MSIPDSPTLIAPGRLAPAMTTSTLAAAAPESVLVIGNSLPETPAGFEHADLRFVDPACAASLLERERPTAVIADLELLSRSPCGIELRRSLDMLVMQGEVTVTWVRND